MSVQKFIILTNARSGSNYLVDTLNQHPEIINYSEVLGEWTGKRKLKKLMFWLKNDEEYLNFILSSSSFQFLFQIFYKLKYKKNYTIKKKNRLKLLGIKEFVKNFDRLQIIDWLFKNELKVIHLYRENQLKVCLSVLALRETGLALSGKKLTKQKKLSVDCNELLEMLERHEQGKERQLEVARLIDKKNLYELSYEELFSENRSTIVKDIFLFLNVDPIQVKEQQKKILPTILADIVENHEEVRNTLTGTEFEKYLFD